MSARQSSPLPQSPALGKTADGLHPRLRRTGYAIGALLMLAGALVPVCLPQSNSLTTYFLSAQDAPNLMLAGIALVAAGLMPGTSLAWTHPLTAPSQRSSYAAALMVVIAAFAGTYLIFRDFPLSRDEVMANFDAAILREGRLVAPVPTTWRGLAPALQPLFALPVPGNVAWLSSYMPGDAALRALVSLVLPIEMTGPLLAAIAVLAAAGVARRLWPDRPDAAIVGCLAVATSPQVLFAAMTPHAMTAHLTLNLVWLFLFPHGCSQFRLPGGSSSLSLCWPSPARLGSLGRRSRRGSATSG